MSPVTDILFTTIPLVAFIANVFLLFTLISAKKDSSIYSFMGLLFAFVLWTGGSYMMRMQSWPGVVFWWKISLAGIFLVPYMYYLLVASYLEQRGYFLKAIWGILTLFMELANIFDLFMTSPVIKVSGNAISSDYSLKWPAIFAAVIAVLIFFSIFWIIVKAARAGMSIVSYMLPLIIGVFVMVVGIVINTIPAFTSYPTDTLACAINAGCIYYAFYKKRFYAMSQITSKGSVYVISLTVTSILIYQLFVQFKDKIYAAFSGSKIDPTIILIIGCAAVAILLFVLLNKLNDGVFVRDRNRREDKVRDFAQIVNSTLDKDEILKRLSAIIKEEVPVTHLFFCMYDVRKRAYVSDNRQISLEEGLIIGEDHPLVRFLKKKKKGFIYVDFTRSALAKSLREDEKRTLALYKPAYVMPFSTNGDIIGFAILSEKEGRKDLSYSDICYLESATSVASIALKNALLYEKLEAEAMTDTLTGLLNRGAFAKKLESSIEETGFQASLILINMDDFGLYNELYGNAEGDKLLVKFGEILLSVFGQTGTVARYGGNEYSILLPYTDPVSAKKLVARVKTLLERHINDENERIKKFLTFSAGICAYPAHAGNANELLTYANLTVFQIKQHGKNEIAIYNQEKTDKGDKENQVEELLPTIYALTAAIDAKDHYTFNHSRCVSEYASQLAAYAGFGDEMVEVIRQAGLLHDIGKIGIPDAILTKTDRLSNEEYDVMKQHVERSIEMIRHLPALDYVIPAVLGHHERFDGKGYPRGISGNNIPISARCLAVADSFDAMISKRSYKNKMPLEVSLSEIERNLGTQFDPELGRLFVDLIREEKIKVIPY